MSGAFILATDNPPAEPRDEFVGREIFKAAEALDRLAEQLNVLPLSSFISVDEGDQELLREMAEEAGADTSSWQPEPVQWFDPAEGLKSVRALRRYLATEPKAVSKSNAVMEELTLLDSELTEIAQKKAHWRFWIDY